MNSERMPEQDILEIQQPPTLSRRKALGLGLSALGASILIACGVKPGEKPESTAVAGTTVPETKTPEATKTQSPPSGSSEGQSPTPTATSTPEVKKDVPCKVFPAEFCQGGARVVNKAENITYIGFNFDTRVPVYAPRGGNIAVIKDEGHPFSGSSISVYTATEAFQVLGNIEVVPTLSSVVKEGDLLGYTKGAVNGSKSLGEFDVVVTAAKVNTAGTGRETDTVILQNLFPEAFKKPNKEFTSQRESKPGVGVVFLGPNPQ